MESCSMLLHTRGHPTCVEVSYDYSNEYAYPYFYIGQLKGQEGQGTGPCLASSFFVTFEIIFLNIPAGQ